MVVYVPQDDLSSAEVQSLMAEHLSGMHGNSPPGHVHALAIEDLRAPNVTFWSARADGLGCFGEYTATDSDVFTAKVLVQA